jgi:DNA-binding IclR family transcriptional regulator
VDERGFAIADEEQMLGIRAVGVPVMRVDGTPAGAISVSGPTSRLKGSYLTEELPEMVTRATNVTEIKLNRERRSDSGGK